MTDVSWTLGLAPDGDVTVDRVEGSEIPSLTRAETEPLVLGFDTEATYETVREYLDYPTATVTDQTLDGTPFYRNTSADVNEVLVSLRPTGADMPNPYTGVWAAIVGGEDRTNGVANDYRIEFDLFVLAEYGEHMDRAAAKETHEV